jgi:hypothetical protein
VHRISPQSERPEWIRRTVGASALALAVAVGGCGSSRSSSSNSSGGLQEVSGPPSANAIANCLRKGDFVVTDSGSATYGFPAVAGVTLGRAASFTIVPATGGHSAQSLATLLSRSGTSKDTAFVASGGQSAVLIAGTATSSEKDDIDRCANGG